MYEMIDYKLSSDIDLKGMQLAYVMNHPSSNDIGVYFPKLMCDIEKANQPREKKVTLNSMMIKNQNKRDFNPYVNEANYLLCTPLETRGMTMNLAPIGSQVFIEFLDGDPKKAFYLPYRFIL